MPTERFRFLGDDYSAATVRFADDSPAPSTGAPTAYEAVQVPGTVGPTMLPVGSGWAPYQPPVAATPSGDDSALTKGLSSIGTALINAGGLVGSAFVTSSVQSGKTKLLGFLGSNPAPAPVQKSVIPSWVLPAGVVVGALAVLKPWKWFRRRGRGR